MAQAKPLFEYDGVRLHYKEELLMNVLVTGSSGFIGSKLVNILLSRGCKVSRLMRHESMRKFNDETTLVLRENSVTGFESALSIKFDYIFNLASYGVDRNDKEPEKMISGNILFLNNLLRSLSYTPKLVINVGSCAEYGVIEENNWVREDHVLAPTNLYGSLKASSTLVNTQMAKDKGVPLINIRLFGVYGEGEADYRLLPYLINRLNANLPVQLTSGLQQRDLLYVDDVVSAFLSVLCHSDKLLNHDIYNVCSGIPISVRDYVTFVAEHLGKPPELLEWGKLARNDEPAWVVGCNERFKSCTGWSPSYSIKAGLERAIRLYKGTTVD